MSGDIIIAELDEFDELDELDEDFCESGDSYEEADEGYDSDNWDEVTFEEMEPTFIKLIRSFTWPEWIVIFLTLMVIATILYPVFNLDGDERKSLEVLEKMVVPYADLDGNHDVTQKELNELFSTIKSETGLLSNGLDYYKDGVEISRNEALTIMEDYIREEIIHE